MNKSRKKLLLYLIQFDEPIIEIYSETKTVWSSLQWFPRSHGNPTYRFDER